MGLMGLMGLIAEVFADEHHGVAALGRVAEEVYVVADALGRISVMAYTIHLTGGVDIEAGGIDG